MYTSPRLISLLDKDETFQDPKAAATTTAAPTNLTEPWELNNRLDEHVKPILYDVFLNPALGKKSFSGNVTITVNVTKATTYIYLHKNYLNIEDTKVTRDADNKTVALKDKFQYDKNQYWVMKFEDSIEPGTYRLMFKFKGNFSKKNEGFYESAYVNFKNHKR